MAREVLAVVVTVLADPASADRADALRRLAEQDALLPLGRLLRRRARAAPRPDAAPRTRARRRHVARRPRPHAGRAPRPRAPPHARGLRRAAPRPAPHGRAEPPPEPAPHRGRRPPHGGAPPRARRRDPRGRAPPRLVPARARPHGHRAEPRRSTPIAVPLVRLLLRPELEQVLTAADVPAVVRAAASELLERRPPVPVRGDGGEPQ